MKMDLKLFVLGSAILICALCEEETCSPEEIMEDNLKQLRRANNYFAANLHRKLATLSDENIIFSPFTLSSILTMLYIGTRGETAQELKKLLGFHKARMEDSVIFSTSHHFLTQVLGNVDQYSYTINCASALVVDKSFPLHPEYASRVQELFQAYVRDVDIAEDSAAVVDKLNTWVKSKTKGTIKSLVDAIDPAAILLLASAAYFKGAWRIKFDPEDTKYHPFYNGGRLSDRNDVLMMHATATYRYYEEDGEFSAIEMAYEGKNMSMVVFLPEEIDGLPDVEQAITASRVAFVRRRMYYTKVHLTVPKFKLGFNRDLSKELQELGLVKMFSSGGDFSGMTVAGSGLVVGEVRHKAMIEVNEKGSVAAAISTVLMTKMMPISETVPEFMVNHPFLFTIVDTRSGLILFMGRVNKL